jgi:hypothetical protein
MRVRATAASSRVTLLGMLVGATGIVLTMSGIISWLVVRRQLVRERITVEADADHFAGDRVAGPFTAYAEAEAIRRHALEAAGGKSFAELDSGDPATDTVLTGSFMRASLFMSVLSFGVAALTAGLGVALAAAGTALARLSRRQAGSA